MCVFGDSVENLRYELFEFEGAKPKEMKDMLGVVKFYKFCNNNFTPGLRSVEDRLGDSYKKYDTSGGACLGCLTGFHFLGPVADDFLTRIVGLFICFNQRTNFFIECISKNRRILQTQPDKMICTFFCGRLVTISKSTQFSRRAPAPS